MKILCFAGYYIPAYKAGGPIKTILNMVEQLPELEFSIVTRDRDLGDNFSFQTISLDKWQKVGNSDVFYLTNAKKLISDVIKIRKFDVIYLNSFFDFGFSIKIILALKLNRIKPCAVILAPRGEFSVGALAIKPFKKKIYIKLASILGLYKHVIWQASSTLERNDIIAALSVSDEKIFIAKDLPSKNVDFKFDKENIISSELRIVFISRISPMKNLDFALKVLSSVKGDVIFDIYGPQEDKFYWAECESLISKLPCNIKVTYRGIIHPEDIMLVFSKYDLFLFPTRGENYGHVIAESLSVGTSVLTSDQTPWQRLPDDELGWDLPLDRESLFVEKLEELAKDSIDTKILRRKKVLENSSSRISNKQDVINNKRLFEFAFQKFKEYKA